ncbi:long chain fatty acid CoA ligase, putative, partial [Ixodes scapularis]
PGVAMGFVTLLFRVVTTVYDLVTLPVYIIVQRPWNRRRRQRSTWAAPLTDAPGAPMVRLTPDTARTRFKGCETVDALFRHAVSLHSDRPCLGTRLVKSQTQEIIDGKSIVKYDLGEYKWKTYADVESQVNQIGRGLAGLGIVPETRVIIFAETREEWILAALACFRRRVIVCTIYATLGDEGIVFSVNETEGRVMITSEELLPRLQKLMRRLRHVKRIIYMPARGESRSIPDMAPAIVMPFADLLASATVAGESPPVVPVATDVVIIMYTSGSTGTPKGKSEKLPQTLYTREKCANMPVSMAQDVYLGFLPLAHVMEIAAECCFMALGLRIGYSSPFTLTDQGTALMPNTPGDASVLRPTLMIAVPLLLNRIQKAVEQNLASTGAFKQNLFAFALPYKSYWRSKGYTTPLLNRSAETVGTVLKCTRRCFEPFSPPRRVGASSRGGRNSPTSLELLASAHVLTSTRQEIDVADDDIMFGVAGPPLNGVHIKLVNWDEGGYRSTDKPYPRGEIVVGGPTVAAGYFKRPELTLECFESGPIPWFYTGDIGEFIPQGLLRIIDRKKDLVKLQYGEYVSLGKVETVLKTHPLVDNVCVIGSSLSTFIVALIQPSEPALRKLAETAGL